MALAQRSLEDGEALRREVARCPVESDERAILIGALGERYDRADARARIFIESNRDGLTVNWARHPTARGQFATSPGAALDAAIEQLDGEPAVIIWGGRMIPP